MAYEAGLTVGSLIILSPHGPGIHKPSSVQVLSFQPTPSLVPSPIIKAKDRLQSILSLDSGSGNILPQLTERSACNLSCFKTRFSLKVGVMILSICELLCFCRSSYCFLSSYVYLFSPLATRLSEPGTQQALWRLPSPMMGMYTHNV